ncbi:hypothetical protein GCM10011352_36240 [Marinobacterium zhoushanense]|uniref:Uncharacterized protein n=1 Tax=Marinobacterium zhoushanense TaxID=1679163 RepID=A0ABQ1KQ98_9GAMM|nr:hypothetical protein GCM10011352_36240 [Marinobacterium zhoushanense]
MIKLKFGINVTPQAKSSVRKNDAASILLNITEYSKEKRPTISSKKL